MRTGCATATHLPISPRPDTWRRTLSRRARDPYPLKPTAKPPPGTTAISSVCSLHRRFRRLPWLSGSSQLPEGAVLFNLTELQAALNGALISARYQPTVRLSDREPIALEVLARLDHP